MAKIFIVVESTRIFETAAYDRDVLKAFSDEKAARSHVRELEERNDDLNVKYYVEAIPFIEESLSGLSDEDAKLLEDENLERQWLSKQWV